MKEKTRGGNEGSRRRQMAGVRRRDGAAGGTGVVVYTSVYGAMRGLKGK